MPFAPSAPDAPPHKLPSATPELIRSLKVGDYIWHSWGFPEGEWMRVYSVGEPCWSAGELYFGRPVIYGPGTPGVTFGTDFWGTAHPGAWIYQPLEAEAFTPPPSIADRWLARNFKQSEAA